MDFMCFPCRRLGLAAGSGGSGVRVNGRRKVVVEGDRPVCNTLQTMKTGETAPTWHGHYQAGSLKAENPTARRR